MFLYLKSTEPLNSIDDAFKNDLQRIEGEGVYCCEVIPEGDGEVYCVQISDKYNIKDMTKYHDIFTVAQSLAQSGLEFMKDLGASEEELPDDFGIADMEARSMQKWKRGLPVFKMGERIAESLSEDEWGWDNLHEGSEERRRLEEFLEKKLIEFLPFYRYIPLDEEVKNLDLGTIIIKNPQAIHAVLMKE